MANDPDKGVKNAIQTVKDYAPVAKGVAKTFFTGGAVSGKPEEEVDFGPGPTPKSKTPPPPSEWYKDSSAHKIPSYKEGTNYVPHTGPAILHEGEAVVPKDKNMAVKSEYRALYKLRKARRQNKLEKYV